MDLVTTGVQNRQPPTVTKQEEAARPNGKSPVANLVDRLEGLTGVDIPPDRRPMVEGAVHFGLGVVPGAIYAAMRRAPLAASTRGLALGMLLWALNDEFLNSRLELAGPFGAYPLEAHWRGLIGHLAHGITTDTTIDLLGG